MKRKDRVVLYRDTGKDWRWRYVRSNGRILAASSEGYRRKVDCLKAMTRVTGGADITVEGL